MKWKVEFCKGEATTSFILTLAKEETLVSLPLLGQPTQTPARQPLLPKEAPTTQPAGCAISPEEEVAQCATEVLAQE